MASSRGRRVRRKGSGTEHKHALHVCVVVCIYEYICIGVLSRSRRVRRKGSGTEHRHTLHVCVVVVVCVYEYICIILMHVCVVVCV